MKNWRFRISFFFFIFFLLLIVFKLYYWQVVRSDDYTAKAETQRAFSRIILPQRGQIMSEDSRLLVTNQAAFLLYAESANLKNSPKVIAEKLALILTEPEKTQEEIGVIISRKVVPDGYQTRLKNKINDLYLKLTDKKLQWVALEGKITSQKKNQIENLHFSGLGFQPISDRLYPEATSAGHLSGFVGKDINGEDIGYFGLEGYYNQELAGQKGSVLGERDIFGIPILIGNFFRKPARDGYSLKLNLDLSVQKIIEQRLKEGIRTYQAKGGTVIVLNPQNGAVIAMSSYPSYEPSSWQEYPEESYKNPAIADTYEPGSIFKPLIMAAAINENKVKPTTKCPVCQGPREIGGHLIRTFNNDYYSDSTMTEILIHSDNVGMSYVGETLGAKKIYQYLEKYGFGKETGIDLQEETSGSLRPVSDWYDIDKATVTFGQGIGVTSIQMARALSSLANKGVIYQPQVVNAIQKQEGRQMEITPKKTAQVLKPETTRIITEMLVTVCNQSPLKYAKDGILGLEKYKIAAKSGTAQIAISGKYQEGKTIGSVIGYFPAMDPEFFILVKLTEPEANPWGANTAGPIFFQIIKDLILYYGISP